jgi:hypothetical protein
LRLTWRQHPWWARWLLLLLLRQVLQLMVLHLLMTRLAPAAACTTWRCHRLLSNMHYGQSSAPRILLLLLPVLLLLPHLGGSRAKVWVAACGGWFIGASCCGPAQYERLLREGGPHCLQHYAHVERLHSLREGEQETTVAQGSAGLKLIHAWHLQNCCCQQHVHAVAGCAQASGYNTTTP